MINEKYLGHFFIDRPTYLIRRTNYTWDGMMQLYNFVVQTCCFRCLFHLNQNILARNNIFPWMIIEHWSNPLTFNFAEKYYDLVQRWSRNIYVAWSFSLLFPLWLLSKGNKLIISCIINSSPTCMSFLSCTLN